MKTITLTHNSHTDREEPLHEEADEEDLLSPFEQYSDLMTPNLDWLPTDDAIIINEVSIESISAAHHVTVQQHATTVLFNTGANMQVIS